MRVRRTRGRELTGTRLLGWGYAYATSEAKREEDHGHG